VTRQEYRRWLAYQVRRGELDAENAAWLLEQFDAGELDPTNMPLPTDGLLESVRRPPAQQEKDGGDALLLILAALGLLTASRRRRTASQRLSMVDRRRTRDLLRAEWNATAARLAADLARTGNVQGWQTHMARAIRDYYTRQYTAGAGRALTAAEWRNLDAKLIRQAGYLARFAHDAHAHAATGQPYSAGYLANRSNLYGGGAWALWHEAVDDEYADQPGWVVYYLAVDDDRTCDECMSAESQGPYLPGAAPMPGEVCQGGSRCRCSLDYRWEPETYAVLGGI
jgi:hypothetical protein